MIHSNSLDAYSKVDLNTNQQIVYDALWEIAQGTNAEIAAKLNWPINRVTPRIKELRDKNKVIFVINRNCFITGSKASVWRPNI
jgi:DNA-binding MarR family transcriptional regulator